MTKITEKDRSQATSVALLPSVEKKVQPSIISTQPSVVFLYSGMAFLLLALVLFGVLGFSLYRITQMGPDIEVPSSFGEPTPTTMTSRDIYNFYGRIMSVFLAPLLVLVGAGICVFVGIKLLGAAGAVSAQVIPPQEYELLAPAIRDGNEKAITEYIRLSSLSGMTGTFTKVGLTGLPLATIILTIVLAVLGVFNNQFFDLAQLTLGAFLGSYVQKQSETTDNQTLKLPGS